MSEQRPPLPGDSEEVEPRAPEDTGDDGGGDASCRDDSGDEDRDEEQSVETWEVIYGVLFQPQKTIASLAASDRPPLGLAVLTFVVVSLLGAWTNLFTSVPLFESRLVGALERLPVVLFILSLLAGAAAWFGWTATVQLVAEFMGGRGRGIMLFSLVGFAYLPRVFAAPVAVLANLTGYDIQLPVHVALLLWSLYLTFLSVRHVHGLNRVRALSAVLLPGAALVGLAVLVVLSVAVFLLPFLGKLGNFPL